MTKQVSVLTKMVHPAPPVRSGAPSDGQSDFAGHASAAPGPMGPLEIEQYKKEWRAGCRYRAHLEKAAADRKHDLMMKQLERDAVAAAEKAMRDASGKRREGTSRGIASLRQATRADEEEDDDEGRPVPANKSGAPPPPVTAGRVAARLMFARLFDARPEIREALKASAPVVVVDVPDGTMMDRVAATWKDVLFNDTTRLLKATGSVGQREHYDAVYLVVKEPPKAKDKPAAQTEALSGLSLALPFVAISPLGATHLPEALHKSCTARLEMPRIDAATITRVIRIITGKPCRDLLDPATAAKTGLDDLIIAVRFDRSPAACMAELRRLVAAKETDKKSRDLALDQLHGMADAVAWAKSTIADLADWKAGKITWDAVDSGVALTGPPGTGKSTFAKVFAAEAGMPIISGTLAKWQSSGEAHLGHLLRAMRQDFDAARAQAPSVLFIDEIDSFPVRSALTHAHRDYVIEVVNGLLEQIDGIAGREGVIVVGASNDLRRCDPALLRAGRLNRIVKIGLPDPVELIKMLRVRLGDDLRDEDLRDVSELAAGLTGADVEKVVKDAKRTARHANRKLTIGDLRNALVEEDDDRPAELKYRACVHEASHIVVDVIHNGPKDVFATVAVVGGRAGAVVRTKRASRAGTYDDYRKSLEMILAGRIGEEMILEAAGHGAGGESGSDLERATTMAAAMAGSVGLAGPTKLVYLGPVTDAHSFVAFDDIRATVDAELQKAAKSCRDLLERHREAVEEIARRLLHTSRIDGAEVARILNKQALEGNQ